jgi:SH3 domain-containing protein
MRISKVLVNAIALGSLVIIIGCSPIQRTNSGFDNLETISMVSEQTIYGAKDLKFRLVWDEKMPFGNNLVKLYIYRIINTSPDTMINLNVDGVKHKFKIIDTNKETVVGSENKTQWVSGLGVPLQAVNREVITQTDKTTLNFYLPDTVLSDVIKSENSIMMINFANNERIEADFNSVKFYLTLFYKEKHSKSLVSNTENTPAIAPVSNKIKLNDTSTIEQPQIINQTKSSNDKIELKRISSAATITDISMVISSNKSRLRKEPSTNAKVIKNMNKGDIVKIIKQQGDWFMIKLASSEIGWCHKSVLKFSN